jgi:hypothetical protein
MNAHGQVNAPDWEWWFYIGFWHLDTYQRIVAFSMNTGSDTHYEKSCRNGNWSEWREVAHKDDISENLVTMIPDYANREATNRINTEGGTWTVDRDGFVFAGGGTISGSDGTINVVINGKNAAVLASPENNTAQMAILLPVKQGDVVQINFPFNGTFSSAICYYVPYTTPFTSAYSTSEVKTGNVWIDGKPIYRKVIQGTTSATVGAGGASMVGTAISGFSELVTLKANVKSGSLTFADAYTDPDNFGFSVYMNGGAVFNQVWNATFAEKPITAIVEYTKA